MKFYFDMDGVLVNFDAMIPWGAKYNHPSETLNDEDRAAKKRFWQTVEQTPNFWRDMPMMPDTKNMLSTAQKIGEIFVLSKTPGAKHFVGGNEYVKFVANEKRNWIKTNLPSFFDEQHIIICDGNKGELIHPIHNDILIDDRQENITEWEKHRGRGILFTNAIATANKIKTL